MTDSPSAIALGQVSADGQFRWNGAEWAPIPTGEREPTSWTRPMRLASAALFAVQAVYSVVVTFVFVTHDAMLRAIQAQGTQLPSDTDVDAVVDVAIALAIAVAVCWALLQVAAAAGSYLGWRWVFWPAVVLFGLGGLSALGNVGVFLRPAASPMPVWAVSVSELFDVASLGMFVWLLAGLVRFGPWAMKRPGA